MSPFDIALAEIKALKKCKITYQTKGCVLFDIPLFYGRLLNNSEAHIEIQLAEKATFDRWANSINFRTLRTKAKNCYYPSLVQQVEWAEKVLGSGLFDFSSYLSVIELPWFESKKL